jgi:hypothetical protein
VLPADSVKGFSAFDALRGKPKERRLIRFYDTAALGLFQRSVILRSREALGGGSDPVGPGKDGPDATVKARGDVAKSVTQEEISVSKGSGEGKREGDLVLHAEPAGDGGKLEVQPAVSLDTISPVGGNCPGGRARARWRWGR